MSYPCLANWNRFKRIDRDTYLVKSVLEDNAFEMNTYSVWFAHQLDGKTDPYTVDEGLSEEETEELLDELYYEGLIRDKRILLLSVSNTIITLCKVKATKVLRIISYFINLFVMISVIPLLVISIYSFSGLTHDMNLIHYMLGLVVGLIFGMLFHEMAHMWACLGFGGRVYEMGVMFRYFMPGAYVLLEVDNIKSRLQRAQVHAAGVEMNLIIGSLSLIFMTNFAQLGSFFYASAVCNFLIAAVNLTVASGIDGINILSELLGVQNLADNAKKVIRRKNRRRLIDKKGIYGVVIVLACYIIRFLQISMPILIALNVAEVFLWIELI